VELLGGKDSNKAQKATTMKSENRIASKVSDLGEEASDKFDEIQSTVTDSITRISRDTGQFIRERPWTAVAIVAAVGIALGFLLKDND